MSIPVVCRLQLRDAVHVVGMSHQEYKERGHLDSDRKHSVYLSVSRCPLYQLFGKYVGA